MTRSNRNSVAKRKHVKFHRSWKSILTNRENKIQQDLRNKFSGNFTHSEESEPFNDDVHTEHTSFEHKLKYWAVIFGISMRALDNLLEILRAAGHEYLPKSYRTLLGTPRNIELANYGEAKYWYRGISDCLRVVFSNLKQDLYILLKFNIDGLPIFNSSTFQFWPILASVHRKLFFFTAQLIDLMDEIKLLQKCQIFRRWQYQFGLGRESHC